jgi:SM-20-related protein
MNTVSNTQTQLDQDRVFTRIAEDLAIEGLSIQPNAIPEPLAQALWAEVSGLSSDWFHRAGIGRLDDHHLNRFNRTDRVCWIEGSSQPCRAWLAYTEQLRTTLNRELFLGLFSYESHYAQYQIGDYYKRHLDAFQGEANRRVSTVLYLNPGWQPDDGGELVIYADAADRVGTRVTPAFATLVCFLSERFPHEVLPAKRTRYSIAGWYRVNASTAQRVDPPR